MSLHPLIEWVEWVRGIGGSEHKAAVERAKEAAEGADTSEPGALRKASFDREGDVLPSYSQHPLR